MQYGSHLGFSEKLDMAHNLVMMANSMVKLTWWSSLVVPHMEVCQALCILHSLAAILDFVKIYSGLSWAHFCVKVEFFHICCGPSCGLPKYVAFVILHPDLHLQMSVLSYKFLPCLVTPPLPSNSTLAGWQTQHGNFQNFWNGQKIFRVNAERLCGPHAFYA